MPRQPKVLADVQVDGFADDDDDELVAGDVIYRGDGSSEDAWPTDVTVNFTDHMGHGVVYDRQSYEPSRVLLSMMPHILKARDGEGHLIYTRRRPATPPVRGTVKCYLHSDDPERSRYAKMGFPICKKSTLVSDTERENHMKVRHPRAWQTIQAERVEAKEEHRRREDREHQEKMMAMQLEVLRAVVAKGGA